MRWACPITVVLLLLSVSACRQDMAQQPSFRPLRPSAFFADGRSARPAVEGTVARGSKLSSGRRPFGTDDWARVTGILGALPADPPAAASRTAGWSLYRETFPSAITQRTLERGRERFNIYCAVCHDRVGNGQGMIVARGFTAPPSFHTDWSRGFKLRGTDLKLKEAPVGYYFEVISDGFGAMPDYAEQIAPDDRWAIIAYIRALQLSQGATLTEVRDDKERNRLLQLQGGLP
jgi:mono/diheme cytochrome c family protein